MINTTRVLLHNSEFWNEAKKEQHPEANMLQKDKA